MPAYPRPAGLPQYHQAPAARAAVPSRASVKFRESPFYQIREALTPTKELSGDYTRSFQHVIVTR